MLNTLREVPSDAVIASHCLMIRSGMIKKFGNGLYAYMPLGLLSLRKVENIIREELNKAGLLEIKPTIVQPADLWKESGRWNKMGEEMLKMQNRAGQDMVFSPTAEEAVTSIARDILTSYKQYPVILYQINTKYRDEIRPRYGVMRGREFTMMDAYSFDADKKSLDESYERCSAAYKRIFKRMGLSTISVKASTGSMGGSDSEEFMVESEVGDDTLIICPKCGYAANVEKATCVEDAALDKNGMAQQCTEKPFEIIATPDVKTISDLAKFLGTTPQSFIKTLIYKVNSCGVDFASCSTKRDAKNNDVFVAVCIRGDLDVNEAKLTSVLKAASVELACDEDVVSVTGAPVGFAGPVNLKSTPIIADLSLKTMHDSVTGALQKDAHFIHVEFLRDFTADITADVRSVVSGDKCPNCKSGFYTKKGNELGHIFKLGDKYTKSMNVTYLDENGKSVTPLMGCYGIGVDRTLASIIEEHHDDNGICWPMSTAPFQVAIVPIKYEGDMKLACDKLYDELLERGIEVLLDDRNERPGVKFKDMDLIGIPIRIVCSDKNMPNLEIKMRTSNDVQLVPYENATEQIVALVRQNLM